MKARALYSLAAPWIRLRYTTIFTRQLTNFAKTPPFATKFALKGTSVLHQRLNPKGWDGSLSVSSGALFRLSPRQIAERLNQLPENGKLDDEDAIVELPDRYSERLQAFRQERERFVDALKDPGAFSHYPDAISRWWFLTDECLKFALDIAQGESGYSKAEILILGGSARRLNIFTDLDYLMVVPRVTPSSEHFGEVFACALNEMGIDGDNVGFRYSRKGQWSIQDVFASLPDRVFFSVRLLNGASLSSPIGKFVSRAKKRMLRQSYLRYRLWHFMYATTRKRESAQSRRKKADASLMLKKFMIGMQLISINDGRHYSIEEFSRLADEKGIVDRYELRDAVMFWTRLRDLQNLYPGRDYDFYASVLGRDPDGFKRELYRTGEILDTVYTQGKQLVGHVGPKASMFYFLDKVKNFFRFLAQGDLRVVIRKSS